MKSLLQQEPVAVTTAFTAFIQAVITVAVTFGWSLSNEQSAAVTALVLAGGGLFQVLVVRSQVTPVANPKNAEGKSLLPVQ